MAGSDGSSGSFYSAQSDPAADPPRTPPPPPPLPPPPEAPPLALPRRPSRSGRTPRRGRAADPPEERAAAVEEVAAVDLDDWGYDFVEEEEGVGGGGGGGGVAGGGVFVSPLKDREVRGRGEGGGVRLGELAGSVKSLFGLGTDGGSRSVGSMAGTPRSAPASASQARDGDGEGSAGSTAQHGDSLRLRASTAGGRGGVSSNDVEEARSAAVIGIYADPTAEKDDWADDFQLDSRGREGAVRRSASTGDGAFVKSKVLELLLKQPGSGGGVGDGVGGGVGGGGDGGVVASESDEFHSMDGFAEDGVEDGSTTFVSDQDSRNVASAGGGGSACARRAVGAAGEIMKRPPERIDWTRAGEQVRYGDEPGDVPSSCRQFLNMCSRHLIAIETHLEQLREDRASMKALESAAETVYSFTVDDDVALVAAAAAEFAASGERRADTQLSPYSHPGMSGLSYGAAADGDTGLSIALAGAAKDMLMWKLEYARLRNDRVETARSVIGVARFEREMGNVLDTYELLEKADAELEAARGAADSASDTTILETLRIEVQYEFALARRRAGELDKAVAIFRRALKMGTNLAARQEDSEVCHGCEQRGLWWSLECKYMLAECFFEKSQFADAVREYVEYATQSILRLIGLIVPTRPDQRTAGHELMRYCLFSPRRLALSVWSASICLAEMGVVDVSANVGSMAMRTATALGVEDVRVATVEFCGRVRTALRASKRQLIAGEASAGGTAAEGGVFLSGTFTGDGRAWKRAGTSPKSETDRTNGYGPVGGPGSDGWGDEVGGSDSLLRDFDAEFAVDSMVELEGDWDAQIAQELNIKIERCSEVTAAYGMTLFTSGGLGQATTRAPEVQSAHLGSPGDGNPGSHSPKLRSVPPLPGSMRAHGTTSGRSPQPGARDGLSGGVVAPVGTYIGRSSGFNAASNDLTESELRQYLSRLNAATVNLTSQQMMYPKPTDPFHGPGFGPKEHEAFLRDFVKRRIGPAHVPRRVLGSLSSPSSSLFPSARLSAAFADSTRAHSASMMSTVVEDSTTNMDTRSQVSQVSMSSVATGSNMRVLDAVRDCAHQVRNTSPSSLAFAVIHQKAVLKVLRTPGTGLDKRQQICSLVNSAFRDLGSLPKLSVSGPRGGLGVRGNATVDGDARSERSGFVASLLEVLKLAREVLSADGEDAVWFSRASSSLMAGAATISPAAKAAVELFRIESRAHYGLARVTPPAVLLLCGVGNSCPSLRSPAGHEGKTDLPSVVHDSPLARNTEAPICVESPLKEKHAHVPVSKRRPPLATSGPSLANNSLSNGFDPQTSASSAPLQILRPSSMPESEQILPELRLSCVDVLHSLYWRTKATIDESSMAAEALERLVHADVCSTLYLIGSSVSSVDGSPIDLSKDESLLNLELRSDGLVDDTRRVHGPQLVSDLQDMWNLIPESAADIRARICLALAHHMRVVVRDALYAERLLFDGLLGIHKMTPTDPVADMPLPAIGLSHHVSPLSAVVSPLCCALLHEYGMVALQRSKYRYGIAALEAEVDARKVRDPDDAVSKSSVHNVASIALSEYDWRRALAWLFDLRSSVQPMNGRRNHFIHLCLLLHQICVDIGCFAAALIPLRAYSALIYEERLRILLARHKERLAKKTRARRRYEMATSVLPSMFPRSRSLVQERSATLASFFPANVDGGLRRANSRPESCEASQRRVSAVIASSEATSRKQSWPNKAAKYLYSLTGRSNGRETLDSAAGEASRSPSSTPKDQFTMQTVGTSRRTVAAPTISRTHETSSAKESVPSVHESDCGQPRYRFARSSARARSSGRSRSFVSETSDGQGRSFSLERDELFAIAEEEAGAADAALFEVEFLKARLAFDSGAYADADAMCRVLLDMVLPAHGSTYFVLEIMARVRLKRREITRCLELVDQMEQQALLSAPHQSFRDYSRTGSEARMSSFSNRSRTQSHQSSVGGSGKPPLSPSPQEPPRSTRLSLLKPGNESGEAARAIPQASAFLPEVRFLRLSALYHGGRLSEALAYADESLEVCPETQLWHRAKLHYMRGKALFSMCSNTTAPFDGDEVPTATNAPVSTAVDMQIVELTMSAFETASGFFDAAGAEVGVVKSDLRWAQTAIDVLFRRVVLSREAGRASAVSLDEACRLGERTIAFSEIEDVVHAALSFLSAANLPLLTIDALAALAELKCIAGEPSPSWSFWVAEGWKLYSRLLTDPEEYKVVLNMAPVSTLMRLKTLCGRLVRLVLCATHVADVESINRHLSLFEAYVALQIDIDRKMNLASGVHGPRASDPLGRENAEDGDSKCTLNDGTRRGGTCDDMRPVTDDTMNDQIDSRDGRPRDRQGVRSDRSDFRGPRNSESPPRDGSHNAGNRPAGAFLHLLSDEGMALSRQGFTVFVKRPREQMMQAIRETGAIVVPQNVARLAKRRDQETATDRALERDQDAELIFPFNEKLGLGAMYILDDASFEHVDEPEMENVGMGMPFAGLGEYEDEIPPAESGRMDSDFRQSRDVNEEAEKVYGCGSGNEDSRARIAPTSAVPAASSPAGSNALSRLVESVRGSQESSRAENKCLGESPDETIWAYMHRIKAETRRYSRGEITLEELGQRNAGTLRSWLQCAPQPRREWSIPSVLGKRLVYILFAHGVVGYYSVDRGSCVSRLEFGGKQVAEAHGPHAGSPAMSSEYINVEALSPPSGRISHRPGSTLSDASGCVRTGPRPPNNAERKFLYALVKDSKSRGTTWYKERESDIVNGLATAVLRTPRVLLDTQNTSGRQKTQRSRPIVLIADLTLQVFPWELFLDHVVIRSLSLLDSIRGLQDDTYQTYNQEVMHEAMVSPTVALNRRIVRFVNFTSPRREGGDLERSEEARRQQLAFQSLLRLNHMSPSRLIACLGLGGFSDPTALNAVARPTGPLSTPLTQSKKAISVLGVRLEARIGRKNYSLLDFVKVPGLGSASTADLREATLVPEVAKGKNEDYGNGARAGRASGKSAVRKELGAYIAVFLFTYADLVDVTESVFGLLRAMPRGILIFAPATKMKVVVRHLEDPELNAELQTASGRRSGRIVPDVGASARVIVEYVSRFARSKYIPIVVFLGEGLIDVWPQKRARISSVTSGFGGGSSGPSVSVDRSGTLDAAGSGVGFGSDAAAGVGFGSSTFGGGSVS